MGPNCVTKIVCDIPGLILGLHPANETLICNDISHWLGANLESALYSLKVVMAYCVEN